ncbi:hypothetical protein ACQHIH_11640 [Xanthomonas sontii]|uniref:hypothetical protein n=1 Tax=Xanthomonas sontii TaxID=2650745 RepID=UPI003F85DC3A
MLYAGNNTSQKIKEKGIEGKKFFYRMENKISNKHNFGKLRKKRILRIIPLRIPGDLARIQGHFGLGTMDAMRSAIFAKSTGWACRRAATDAGELPREVGVIPPQAGGLQKWNFFVPFPEEVP